MSDPDPDRSAAPRPAPPAVQAGRALRIAVVGAGPAGLTLALLAAERLPQARITVYDARPAERDVSGDARTLALSLGSVQLLERLGAWNAAASAPILEVRVTEQSHSPALLGLLRQEPEVRIRAADVGVAQLGAVLPYGAIVAPLQRAWMERAAADPGRLSSRFGWPVTALKPIDAGVCREVEVDAGTVEPHDLAVVAEGGVFAEQARKAVTHDYRQTAWVGSVHLRGAAPGTAWERFTRQGPVALLPLPPDAATPAGCLRASLVWCTDARDDPLEALDDAQRLALLRTRVHHSAGEVVWLGPLKRFPLGLNAERTLVDGAVVRIGNAAQTLHPVAGQGLNLGLRDAWELVDALRRHTDVARALQRVEWRRAPDRWALIATTDFLARSFTWQLPGAALARGLGLAAVQALAPVRRRVAQEFMFGRR